MTVSGLLGTKLRMGRIVSEAGRVVGVTFVSVGPCYVTQIKTRDRDGYEAVQLGYDEARKITRPQAGHLKGLPKLRHLREVARVGGDELEVGQKLDVSLFEVGELVDVTATSKGRGFAGVVRRYGFSGGPKTHGQSDRWRAPGSSGAGTTPGRVLKGTRMAGRMGAERVTVRNVPIVAIDAERNLLALGGSVPGAAGGLVTLKKTPPKRKA
jgi:large subunit ribosomal protein L3